MCKYFFHCIDNFTKCNLSLRASITNGKRFSVPFEALVIASSAIAAAALFLFALSFESFSRLPYSQFWIRFFNNGGISSSSKTP